MKSRDVGDVGLRDACVENTGELSRQSLRLLESLHLNNFENALNLFEDFLYGFELCDHSLHFDVIALTLAAVLASFDSLDNAHDGKISYKEMLDWANKHKAGRPELDWLLCHYEALTKASLLSGDNQLTRPGLQHAEHVFRGLGLVQKRLKSDKIHLEDLLLLRMQRDLTAEEDEALSELISYLRRAGKRGEGGTMSCEELTEVSPEDLWLPPA